MNCELECDSAVSKHWTVERENRCETSGYFFQNWCMLLRTISSWWRMLMTKMLITLSPTLLLSLWSIESYRPLILQDEQAINVFLPSNGQSARPEFFGHWWYSKHSFQRFKWFIENNNFSISLLGYISVPRISDTRGIPELQPRLSETKL